MPTWSGLPSSISGGARRLRREDKSGREQSSDQSFRAAGAAAGDEGGQQHEHRVGERAADVDHFRAQPGGGRHGQVLG